MDCANEGHLKFQDVPEIMSDEVPALEENTN